MLSSRKRFVEATLQLTSLHVTSVMAVVRLRLHNELKEERPQTIGLLELRNAVKRPTLSCARLKDPQRTQRKRMTKRRRRRSLCLTRSALLPQRRSLLHTLQIFKAKRT